MVFLVLAGLISIASIVCGLIVTIDAFKDEIWKGFLCLIGCGLYWIYYALFEFDHDYKWAIVLTAVGGSAVSTALLRFAG